jgi:hypothetical protein
MSISMKNPLSQPERVPLREVWKHEANDFTPWLAEEDNLNTLADALGLPDLELVATWRQDSPIEDETQWGAYLDWFVQRIVKMNAVFRPVIQAIR